MTKKKIWIGVVLWVFCMSIFILNLTPFMIVGVSVIFSIAALLFLRYLIKLVSNDPLDKEFRHVILISCSVIICIFMGLYSYISYASFHYTEYVEVDGKNYVAVPTTGWKNQLALKKANPLTVSKSPTYAKSCSLSFTLATITEGECKIEKYHRGIFKDPAQLFNELNQAINNIDTENLRPDKNDDSLPKNEESDSKEKEMVFEEPNQEEKESHSIDPVFTDLEVYNENRIYETLPGKIYYQNTKRAVINMGKAGSTDMIGIFSPRDNGGWYLEGYVPNSRGVFNFYDVSENYFIFSYNVSDDKITFNFSRDGGMTWKLTQIEPTERRNYAVTSLKEVDNKLCITTGTDPWSTQKIPESTYCSDDQGETWN